MLLAYACDKDIWRPYKYWIRFQRPPQPEPDLPLSYIGHPKRLIPRDAETTSSRRKATSSFFADAIPWTALFRGPAEPSAPLQPVPGTSRPIPGRTTTQGYQNMHSVTSSTCSPPFIYSVAHTMQTINTIVTSPPALRLDTTTTAPSPLGSSPSSYAPTPASSRPSPLRMVPPPLVLRPPTRTDSPGPPTASSVYSDDESGVTSVFATRHSRGSSLPKVFTPSIKYPSRPGRMASMAPSLDGEVVFTGQQVRASSSLRPYTGVAFQDAGREEVGDEVLTPPKKALVPDSPSSYSSRGTFGRIVKLRGGQI